MIRDDRELAREAFARTRVPPSPDLTHRVRERLREERRRRAARDGGWLLGLAGGALALAMVVGLLFDTGALQWPVSGTATPAPQAGTLAQPGPPSGVAPTFLLPAAGGGPALRRLDWTGRTTGSFTPPAGAGSVAVSPDGALVAVRAPDDPSASVLDAGGAVVARLTAFGAWSGDGAHVACALTPAGVVVSDLRDPAHVRSSTGPGPGPGWALLGCSAGTDLLVALRQDRTGDHYTVAEADLIRLSTGRVLAHLAYTDGSPPVAPVLSADARYLAENDPGRGAAAIRDLRSGEVVGHVTGLVAAFSGDGRLVLTNGGSRAAVVDWRWRRTTWAAAGQATPVAARPDGQDLVISLAGGPQEPSRTLLLGGGGHALDLDQGAAGSGPLSA